MRSALRKNVSMTKKKKASKKTSIRLRVVPLEKAPISTDPLDYPSNISRYEKESLAAEARLATKKRK